jgi:hypothetical protein
MKFSEKIINIIENHKDYIENNQDYANNYEHCIADSLQYYRADNSPSCPKKWLERELDTKLTESEFDELCYDLITNGNHELRTKIQGFPYADENAIISFLIGEEEIQIEELIPYKNKWYYKILADYIERETNSYIKNEYCYLDYSYSHIGLYPNIEDLKEILENERSNND